MGEKRNAEKIFVRVFEGGRPREGPRCKWEDNIDMDRKEIRWKYVNWTHLP
jgi:hypothetical protein